MEVVQCFEKGIDDHCIDVDVVIDFSRPDNLESVLNFVQTKKVCTCLWNDRIF